MISAAKYLFALLICIAAGCAISFTALHAFWIGGRVFQSVPAARACDAVGAVILLPARAAFWGMGGLANQSTPLMNPGLYAITNGMLIGFAFYFCARSLRGGKGGSLGR